MYQQLPNGSVLGGACGWGERGERGVGGEGWGRGRVERGVGVGGRG